MKVGQKNNRQGGNNRGNNRQNNRGRNGKPAKLSKQNIRISRRERSSAPAGNTQLVEIDYDSAAVVLFKKVRNGDLKARIKKVLETFQKAKLHTYEDYGLKNFIDSEAGKLAASLGEK